MGFYSGLAFIADLPENIGWNFVFMGLFINPLSILSLRTCDLGASKCKDRGVVVIITVKLHSTKSELRFCASSSPARRFAVSEICDGEDI